MLAISPMLVMNSVVLAENNTPASLLSSVSVLDSPNSVQLECRAQVISAMSNLFGFDMSKYNVTLRIHNVEKTASGYDDSSPENLKYNLSASDGTCIDVTADISGGTVYYIITYRGNGSQLIDSTSIRYSQALPLSLSDKVSTILSRYQTVNRDASYIQPMLDFVHHNSLDQLVDQAKNSENQTHTTSFIDNNLKVRIIFNEFHTSVAFMPSIEGFDYPNVVSVRFNNRLGAIDGFSDQWTAYKLGDTHVKVSRDEAIDIAWKAANNISTVNIFGVGDVYIHLIKDPLVTVSGAVRDNMTAYPMYWIRIPTDKVYYTIDQVQVGVWADTGEIAYCQATGFEGQPEPNGEVASPSSAASSTAPATSGVTDANAASNNTALIIAAVTCGFIAVAAVTLVALKKRNHRNS